MRRGTIGRRGISYVANFRLALRAILSAVVVVGPSARGGTVRAVHHVIIEIARVAIGTAVADQVRRTRLLGRLR